MSRPKNTSKTKSVQIAPSEGMHAVLEDLAARGLMGKNVSDVVLYIVSKELTRMDESGYLRGEKPVGKG